MSKTIIDVKHFEFRWSRITQNCCKKIYESEFSQQWKFAQLNYGTQTSVLPLFQPRTQAIFNYENIIS